MPQENNTNRKLAAILFADIEGYTAIMQDDEATARACLDKFHFTLSTHVEDHNGQIINNYGDGCLCTFDSAVAAAKCAKEVQLVFQTVPKVPVRIGLHSGDVFFEKDNVFGDAVNIASRIESMGVAGSVLLSNTLRNQIKNQEAFELSPLGKFEFKNVEEAMAVYALKNEGLVVPNLEKLKGKLKNKPETKKSNKWVWPTALVGLLLLALVAWGLGWFGNNNQAANAISETDRQKRIAIPKFKNETNDPSMDAFGIMISDWLPKALMGKEEVSIISAQNIEERIAKANLSDEANIQFANATGVDIVIQGKFYQIENNLHIIADIVDIREGNTLHSVQLKKPSDQKSELLEAFQQQLLSYWAVKDIKRFQERPPKYEAFQAYSEGLRLYSSQPEKSIELLKESFQIDTNFFAPVLRLVPLYDRLRMDEQLEETLEFLKKNQSKFSNWEKLKFDAIIMMEEGKYLEVAMLNERLFKMDPSDAPSNYGAAFYYNNANRPAKALELLNEIDERYLDEKGLAISWRSTQKAFSNYRLEQYEPILQLAENYSNPKLFTVLAVQHLKALVRLDSTEALAQTFQNYKEKGIYSPSGKLDLPDHIFLIICNELLLTGKNDLAKAYALQLEEWLNENKVADFPHHLPDVYNNYPLREMEARGFVQYYLGNFDQAISFWEKEEIPATNWADQIERASRLGVAYAKLRKPEKAKAELQKIMALEIEHNDFEPNQYYYSARILSALDQKEEAVDHIRKALDQGFIFFRPAVLDGDPFLLNLYDYAPYLDLIKPKG